jgi:hypothetical protein
MARTLNFKYGTLQDNRDLEPSPVLIIEAAKAYY